jgi:hypothetical protein
MVLQSLRKNPSRTEDAATPKHSPRDDRARASRGESNRRGWLFIALGGILLLVTLTQYWYDKLSGHVTHKDRGMQVKNLKESLKEAVESSRFDLFVPVPGKAPAAYTPTTPASLSPARTLKWESDDSTRAAVEGVVPTVLLDSPAARWTLRWLDLWGAAVQFPLLVGVAENQITANRGMEMPDMAPAMVMQNERDGYGGMLSDFTVAHTPPAGVREEVLFIDFLRTFRDRAVRMVFSYNYRIFEAMLQVYHNRYFIDTSLPLCSRCSVRRRATPDHRLLHLAGLHNRRASDFRYGEKEGKFDSIRFLHCEPGGPQRLDDAPGHGAAGQDVALPHLPRTNARDRAGCSL